jgi:uncharacterized beta-barrel protein YwiB (DUF1934 family)
MKRRKAAEVYIVNASKATNHSEKTRANVISYSEYNDTINFIYNESDEYRVYVVVGENQLSCMRIGESNTFCQFIEGSTTTLIKDSEIGLSLITTKTLHIKKEDDRYEVVYDLYTGDDYIDTITISWEIIQQ